MKRSWLKRKMTTSQLKKSKKPWRVQVHTLRKNALSPSAQAKKRIQALLREIVIARDGGCFMRRRFFHTCSGFTKTGKLILQADHLVSRSNAATYADSRLVVCVCLGLHGWKSIAGNKNKKEYDARARQILSPERVALWDKAEEDQYKPTHKVAYDWKLAEIALQQELQKLTNPT